MQKLQKIIHRLFFYSSRQLLRRKRSYTAIFATSVVLLSLVMTFFEMAESYYLRNIEFARSGTHHVAIKSMRKDYTDDFLTHNRVNSVFTIPYTSLMASSDDASKPARITVETPEINDYLHVQYLWGSPPEDGEIAVSSDLYKAYGYLSAGEENELFFTASQMTYFPLRISGIFDCTDRNAGYAFVTANTQKQIDAGTGAKIKYDHYIRCKNSSDRYIAMVIRDLFDWFKLYDTDDQARLTAPQGLTTSGTAVEIYEPYINVEYLKYTNTQKAAPVMVYSMPVILIAALMMASFMTNWITANAAEYGILGAIGANRRQLCAISAGQIFLIGLVASIPVVLFSSLISNIYISTYNAASGADVDFVYSVPWGKLIEAALWWNVLSCFLTYIGIGQLTLEQPYVMISGSFRSKMPFVKRSYFHLSQKKDRIFHLAFLKSRRQIKSDIIPAIITSLICLVCGVFVALLISTRGNINAVLTQFQTYASDMLISVTTPVSSFFDRTSWITEEAVQQLKNTDGISEIGTCRVLEPESYFYNSRDKEPVDYIKHSVCLLTDGDTPVSTMSLQTNAITTFIADKNMLDLMIYSVIEGNPSDLYTRENQVIVVGTPEEYGTSEMDYHAGDTITLSGEQHFTIYNGRFTKFEYLHPTEFTIAAVIYPNNNVYSDFQNLAVGNLILSSEGAAQIGAVQAGEYDRALVWFDEELTEYEMVAISKQIAATPAFMRFDLFNISMQTDSEKQINACNTIMLSFFIAMLYLSLATMLFVNSSLRVSKMRSEIAVLRQIGAEDRPIYKTLRTETYLASAIGLTISVVLLLGAASAYLSMQTAHLSRYADLYPYLYPSGLVAQIKRQYQQQALMILSLLLPVIPLHLLSFGVNICSTILPLRRILRETITEGLRKDTD